MLAITLINLAARDYQDIAFARIARDQTSASATNMADWLSWLNESARAIAAVRPDASSVIQSFKLAPSTTKQAIPAGSERLLGVTRNLGADGVTVGRVIRFSEDRQLLDEANRDWHTATPASPVREVIYDEKKNPKVFWVTPPALGTDWYIELILLQDTVDIIPANVTTDPFQLADSYGPASVEWMLYRAYAMQSQSTGLWQRALGHFQAFFNILGVKLKGEIWVGPKSPEGYPIAVGK